jgi:hypothetical protein
MVTMMMMMMTSLPPALSPSQVAIEMTSGGGATTPKKGRLWGRGKEGGGSGKVHGQSPGRVLRKGSISLDDDDFGDHQDGDSLPVRARLD